MYFRGRFWLFTRVTRVDPSGGLTRVKQRERPSHHVIVTWYVQNGVSHRRKHTTHKSGYFNAFGGVDGVWRWGDGGRRLPTTVPSFIVRNNVWWIESHKNDRKTHEMSFMAAMFYTFTPPSGGSKRVRHVTVLESVTWSTRVLSRTMSSRLGWLGWTTQNLPQMRNILEYC